MGKKTIEIEEEAYNRLMELKREGESFTDLITRLAKNRSLLELPGLIDNEAAEDLRDIVEKRSEGRKESRKMRE